MLRNNYLEMSSKSYDDLCAIYPEHKKSLNELYESGYSNGTHDTVVKVCVGLLAFVGLAKIYDDARRDYDRSSKDA